MYGPGIYSDIDIDRYHWDPNLCERPSISGSGLKLIAECPAKYWAYSPYNKNRFDPVETKALSLGKAAHALVLGEPQFNKYFVIAPYDNFARKPGHTWYNDEWKPAVEAGTEKRTLLKPGEFDTVDAMARAQLTSPQVAQAFLGAGRPEISLIYTVPEVSGFYCRSRPDWLPDDPSRGFVVDYKTAETIDPEKLSIAAWKYGYHVQAAMQMDAVRACFGVEPLGIAHVCQEKKPPYLAELRMFTPEQLEIGGRIYRRAFHTFVACMQSGIWPAYTTAPQYFETPRWITAQQQWEDENGNDNEDSPSAGDYLRAG
jgi:hypothetical protein